MIKIIRYLTLNECMAAYFNCEIQDVPKQGNWEWMDGNRFRVWSMKRVLKQRQKKGTWGWCENKKKIHIWIADYAKDTSIIGLLAHEIGHTQRPFKKISAKEEAKAETYRDVALTAFKIYCELKGQK